MDNLRAMREARYEQAQKRGAAAKPAARSAVRPPVAPDTPAQTKPQTPTTASMSAVPVAASAEPAVPGEELCGHRNMSGRTCTRERGHAAKSHRYS